MRMHASLHDPVVYRRIRLAVSFGANRRFHAGIRGACMAGARNPRRRHEDDEQKVQVLLNFH